LTKIKIGALAFLDYVMSTPRGCTKIVKAQRSMYTNPSDQGFYSYESIKGAMRRAMNATDPDAVLQRCVSKASKIMEPHYEAIANGFSIWRSQVKDAGVSAKDASWSIGNLTVTFRYLIGLAPKKGPKVVVLTYTKEPVLTQDEAELVLRIMEHAMPQILPDAVPMVLDTRRARVFKLRANTNRPDLDAVLAAEAAKYVTHWDLAA
jgi:hypothetical protein